MIIFHCICFYSVFSIPHFLHSYAHTHTPLPNGKNNLKNMPPLSHSSSYNDDQTLLLVHLHPPTTHHLGLAKPTSQLRNLEYIKANFLVWNPCEQSAYLFLIIEPYTHTEKKIMKRERNRKIGTAKIVIINKLV